MQEIIKRWIDKIYPSEEAFFTALNSRKLTIYFGIDPTGSQLHLGHSTSLLLLRKLQEMGHRIIILIGDFTAQIGDPTEKSSTRQPLTRKQVKQNYKTYKEQIRKIFNPEFKFNSKWLEKMNFSDVIKLASHFTHGQMIKRNMFQERIEKNQEIYINEFLYPLMQGYDSVALDADAELGGRDQTFNMLVGRDLQKIYKNKEKFVITVPLLENPKTKKKLMSKSEGSFIALNDSSRDMYGKIMALADESIIPCFRYYTEVPSEEIVKMESSILTGLNPRDLKAKLACEIVRMYHDEKEADKAEKEFELMFKDKQVPSDIEEFKAVRESYSILDLLFESGLAASKAEAKRLVESGGVSVNNTKLNDWKAEVVIEDNLIIQVGKRRFIKVKK
ncbi:tyrosine--tRNA ligase [Patescibacteria group bacterium]|nr:tyrosine--tRNA ligase [Patescibacteria group bacterium]